MSSSAVGQAHQLLVVLHPVATEDLVETAFRLGIVGLYVPEAGRAALVGDGLAGDDLEPAILAGALLAAVHVAAIEAVDDRQIWTRHLLPVGRAGVDEAGAFVAELVLKPPGDGLDLAAQHGGMQTPAQGQKLAEQVRRGAVGNQPGEPSLLIRQLRGDPVG
jgi:hypothetical protein